MGDIAIRVEGIGKQYRIGKKEKYQTLRDTLASTLTIPFRKVGNLLRGEKINPAESDEMIWALKEVSFEVKRGEVIGIIGGNGAGKSTLLKILSRITEPTTGFAEIHGRVGSLLEVGTGFHPELTGRENVFLNGAVLGMRRAEIERKFDEIIAFSEVEKFVDTPVKHYSSGMYLRLAFSVAAHLDPEILLVDEVLAVGDLEFQKKCLGKMKSISHEQRTVLFVSHNLVAVQSLCTRGVLLAKGRAVFNGPVDVAIEKYLKHLEGNSGNGPTDNSEREGNGKMRIVESGTFDRSEQPALYLIAGQPISFKFSYQNLAASKQAVFVMTIYNRLGVAVTNFDIRMNDFSLKGLGEEGVIVCRIPKLPLPIGRYRVAVALLELDGKIIDRIPNAVVFDVTGSEFFKSTFIPRIEYCSCMISHEWHHEITKPSNAPLKSIHPG